MADPGDVSFESNEKRSFLLSKTFAALKHRNYQLWFLGQLISLIGTWMQNVAQPWLVYDLTKSPFYLGAVSFAAAVPSLTLAVWAGVVVDRTSKRRILFITQTVMMLNAFLLTLDYFAGWVQPWHIVIIALVNGTAQAFDAPTRQAFTIEMVGREDLMNAIGLNSAIFNSARIMGPTLAGIALALVGPGWCFFINGISFSAVLTGLLMMQLPHFVPKPVVGSAATQLRVGLSYIWHDQMIRSLIILVAVSNIFAMGYSTLLPAFARDVLHAGELGLGLMSAAVGAGALIGALLVASLSDFTHKGWLLTFGNIFFPVMVLCLAASRWLPLSLLILVCIGLGFMIQNTTVNTVIQSVVPDELRGRVMGVYTVVFMGFFPIGSLIAGTVAQSFNIPTGAAFGGSIALAFSLFLLWRAPHIRQLA